MPIHGLCQGRPHERISFLRFMSRISVCGASKGQVFDSTRLVWGVFMLCPAGNQALNIFFNLIKFF